MEKDFNKEQPNKQDDDPSPAIVEEKLPKKGTTQRKSKRKKLLNYTFWLILGLTGIFLILSIIPTMSYTLESERDPAGSFAEASRRIKDIKDTQEEDVCDQCTSQFLLHEEETDQVYILIHDVPNSPRSWVDFGEELHEKGSNVIIPLLPQHGKADMQSNNLRNLKPEDLKEYADDTVDIAQGLGKEVIVIGFAEGGTIAGWIAQNRTDVDRVMLVSPYFGIPTVPSFFDKLYINLFSKVPNINMPVEREQQKEHAYEGSSTRSLVSFLRLGNSVETQSTLNPSSVKDIILITNANDKSVNNLSSKKIVERWENGGAKVNSFEFDEDERLPHNIIDLCELKDAPEKVYPPLMDLLNQAKSESEQSTEQS